MNEEQYNDLIKALISINNNITYLRKEQENSWDYMQDIRAQLKKIQFNTGFISFVIFLSIIISIISTILALSAIGSLL